MTVLQDLIYLKANLVNRKKDYQRIKAETKVPAVSEQMRVRSNEIDYSIYFLNKIITKEEKRQNKFPADKKRGRPRKEKLSVSMINKHQFI